MCTQQKCLDPHRLALVEFSVFAGRPPIGFEQKASDPPWVFDRGKMMTHKLHVEFFQPSLWKICGKHRLLFVNPDEEVNFQ